MQHAQHKCSSLEYMMKGYQKNSAIMKNVLTLISSSWYASNIFRNISYWTRIETNKCWKENFHLCDEILCLHLSYWYANVHYLCRLNGAQVLQEVCQVVMKAFIETKFHWKLLDVKLLLFKNMKRSNTEKFLYQNCVIIDGKIVGFLLCHRHKMNFT